MTLKATQKIRSTILLAAAFLMSLNANAMEDLQIKGISADKQIDCENIKVISNNNSKAYKSCLNPTEKTLFFNTSFLEQSTPLLISLNDDRQVSVLMIKNFDFEKALNSLEAKYGPAEIKDSMIQNRMGAKFDQKIATWRNDQVQLQIKKHGSKLNESVLTLAGQVAIEYGRQSAKPSNDL